jgi:TatD DNase family protein
MGKVLAVCISEKKGTQKKNVGSAVFVEDWGLEGDAHAGKWHRQVSLLSGEKIDAFRAKGAEVEDGAFGENLVVEGIDFAKLPVGTRFRCGEVVLELTQIGKECHNGCAIFQKMGECIMPREGVFTRVLKGGKVSVGDEMIVDKAMIFDTHAHYDDEAFDEDRFAMLDSMQENGIGHIVDVCASVGHFDRVYDLVEKYPFVYGAVGVHPDDADKMTEETLEEIRKLCKLSKAVAVGEIGLDYYWHKEEHEHEIQKKMFRAQMEIAREAQMPFMIHSREAAKDTLDIVKDCMKGGMYGGIIHCFSYAKEMAREYLDMGLYLGIGGVVTFKNAKKLKEVVEYAPLAQIVLETDSPYLSPEPNRGKRNDSRNLVYVAREIARIKGVTEEEVIAVTEGNAERLLLR